jgi:hypothetical protein
VKYDRMGSSLLSKPLKSCIRDLLFYKTNNQIWGGLAYDGNNTFVGQNTEARFQMQPRGAAKVWFRFSRRKETKLEGTRILKYAK